MAKRVITAREQYELAEPFLRLAAPEELPQPEKKIIPEPVPNTNWEQDLLAQPAPKPEPVDPGHFHPDFKKWMDTSPHWDPVDDSYEQSNWNDYHKSPQHAADWHASWKEDTGKTSNPVQHPDFVQWMDDQNADYGDTWKDYHSDAKAASDYHQLYQKAEAELPPQYKIDGPKNQQTSLIGLLSGYNSGELNYAQGTKAISAWIKNHPTSVHDFFKPDRIGDLKELLNAGGKDLYSDLVDLLDKDTHAKLTGNHQYDPHTGEKVKGGTDEDVDAIQELLKPVHNPFQQLLDDQQAETSTSFDSNALAQEIGKIFKINPDIIQSNGVKWKDMTPEQAKESLKELQNIYTDKDELDDLYDLHFGETAPASGASTKSKAEQIAEHFAPAGLKLKTQDEFFKDHVPGSGGSSFDPQKFAEEAGALFGIHPDKIKSSQYNYNTMTAEQAQKELQHLLDSGAFDDDEVKGIKALQQKFFGQGSSPQEAANSAPAHPVFDDPKANHGLIEQENEKVTGYGFSVKMYNTLHTKPGMLQTWMGLTPDQKSAITVDLDTQNQWVNEHKDDPYQPQPGMPTTQQIIDHMIGVPGSTWKWNPDNHNQTSSALLELNPQNLEQKLQGWAKSQWDGVAKPAQSALDTFFSKGNSQQPAAFVPSITNNISGNSPGWLGPGETVGYDKYKTFPGIDAWLQSKGITLDQIKSWKYDDLNGWPAEVNALRSEWEGMKPSEKAKWVDYEKNSAASGENYPPKPPLEWMQKHFVSAQDWDQDTLDNWYDTVKKNPGNGPAAWMAWQKDYYGDKEVFLTAPESPGLVNFLQEAADEGYVYDDNEHFKKWFNKNHPGDWDPNSDDVMETIWNYQNPWRNEYPQWIQNGYYSDQALEHFSDWASDQDTEQLHHWAGQPDDGGGAAQHSFDSYLHNLGIHVHDKLDKAMEDQGVDAQYIQNWKNYLPKEAIEFFEDHPEAGEHDYYAWENYQNGDSWRYEAEYPGGPNLVDYSNMDGDYFPDIVKDGYEVMDGFGAYMLTRYPHLNDDYDISQLTEDDWDSLVSGWRELPASEKNKFIKVTNSNTHPASELGKKLLQSDHQLMVTSPEFKEWFKKTNNDADLDHSYYKDQANMLYNEPENTWTQQKVNGFQEYLKIKNDPDFQQFLKDQGYGPNFGLDNKYTDKGEWNQVVADWTLQSDQPAPFSAKNLVKALTKIDPEFWEDLSHELVKYGSEWHKKNLETLIAQGEKGDFPPQETEAYKKLYKKYFSQDLGEDRPEIMPSPKTPKSLLTDDGSLTPDFQQWLWDHKAKALSSEEFLSTIKNWQIKHWEAAAQAFLKEQAGEPYNPGAPASFPKSFDDYAPPEGLIELTAQMSTKNGGGGQWYTDVPDWMAWAHGLSNDEVQKFLADPDAANASFIKFLQFDGDEDFREWYASHKVNGLSYDGLAKNPAAFAEAYGQWKDATASAASPIDLESWNQILPGYTLWYGDWLKDKTPQQQVQALEGWLGEHGDESFNKDLNEAVTQALSQLSGKAADPTPSELPKPFDFQTIKDQLMKADAGHWDSYFEHEYGGSKEDLREKLKTMLAEGTATLKNYPQSILWSQNELDIYKNLLKTYFGEGQPSGSFDPAAAKSDWLDIFPGDNSIWIKKGMDDPAKAKEYVQHLLGEGGWGSKQQKMKDWLSTHLSGKPAAPSAQSVIPPGFLHTEAPLLRKPPTLEREIKKQLTGLIDKLRAPESDTIYNKDDIELARSEDFQQWFSKAPEDYRQVAQQFPYLALDDYQGGGDYTWIPKDDGPAQVYKLLHYPEAEEKGGEIKHPSGQTLQLPGDFDDIHWPGHTKNPVSKDKARPNQDLQFVPRGPDVPGQLEIPLGGGSSWEHQYKYPTIRRGIYVNFNRYKPGQKDHKLLSKPGELGQRHRAAAQLLDEIRELMLGTKGMKPEDKPTTLFDDDDTTLPDDAPEANRYSGPDDWLKLFSWGQQNNLTPEQMWLLAKKSGSKNPNNFGVPPLSYLVEMSKYNPQPMARRIDELTGENYFAKQNPDLAQIASTLKTIQNNYSNHYDTHTQQMAAHLYDKWFGHHFLDDLLAHKILDALELGGWKPSEYKTHPDVGGLGPHWTTHPQAEFGTGESPDENGFPLEVEAEWPGLGEDPDRKDAAWNYVSEKELTANPGAPVMVKKLRIRHPAHPHSNHWHEIPLTPHVRHAMMSTPIPVRKQGRTVLSHRERYAYDQDWDTLESPLDFGEPSYSAGPQMTPEQFWSLQHRYDHPNNRFHFPPNGLNPPSNSPSRPAIQWQYREPEHPRLSEDMPRDRVSQPLFRGLAINLNHPDAAELHRLVFGHHPDDEHLFDSDHGAPNWNHPELGNAILEHLENNSLDPTTKGLDGSVYGLGPHWSTDGDIARAFAMENAHSIFNDPDGMYLPLRITGDWRGLGEDPYRSGTEENYAGEHQSEREMTLLPGAGMNIRDLQIRHPETRQWMSILREPQFRHAAATPVAVRPRTAKRIVSQRELLEG